MLDRAGAWLNSHRLMLWTIALWLVIVVFALRSGPVPNGH